jgi:hypothetical protein
MAPIFYCSCSNCSCTATVLLTQKMEVEGNKVEETVNCEELIRRKEYDVQNQKQESQTSEIETLVFLAGGVLLLVCKCIRYILKCLIS